jgi:hypothetical protein
MTLAQKFKFLDRFEEQIKTLKTVLSHLGLYIGLVAFTALGAWVSTAIYVNKYDTDPYIL